MASYLDFHGNESMPHQMPPSLADTHIWEHGLLNTVPVPSVLNSYTGYPAGRDDLEISQFSELLDDHDTDIIPSANPPSSFHQWHSAQTPELCTPDPDLGLTPEKREAFPRSKVRNDVKDKTERKVRFDVASSSESEFEKSPDVNIKGKMNISDKISSNCGGNSIIPSLQSITCEDHNTEYSDHPQELSKVYPYAVKHVSDSTLQAAQIIDIENVLSTDNKKKKAKLKNIPPKVPKGDNSLTTDDLCDNSLVRREQEENPVVLEYNFPFKDGEDQDQAILLSSAFERPEYNSTLKLGNELKDLTAQRPDVAKAVKKSLEKSESLRTGINEKAASRVNSPGDVFQGLATLEVPIDDIISQVERDQRSKVKPSCGKQKKNVKSKELQEPDLMEFFTSDLQREQVDLSVTGVSFLKDTLSLAPHDKAFDMYKHNLAWEEFDW